MFEVVKALQTPEELKQKIKLSKEAQIIKKNKDFELKQILCGEINKILLIIGPCSAHDVKSVYDYVQKLSKIQDQVYEKIFIVVRVYKNKPRSSTKSYKGMFHQPSVDEPQNIEKGIYTARKLYKDILEQTKMSIADELLYPESYFYFEDLISYYTIGTRSVENQTHKLFASGIDCPVGVKNPINGNLETMLNVINDIQISQNLIYDYKQIKTTGNNFSHAILRGYIDNIGTNIPNYYYENLFKIYKLYKKLNLENPAIIIDANHSNSNKKFKEQLRIVKNVLFDMELNKNIKKIVKGFMIESFIEEDNQAQNGNIYGKSITDPCLGFEDTIELIYQIAQKF